MPGFAERIEVSRPQGSVAVSLTGAWCALRCAHCGGHYLRAMKSPRQALRLLEKGLATSVLVSGGCDSDGRMDLGRAAAFIREVKRTSPTARVNLHLGLPTREDCDTLRDVEPLVDAACFDFVFDDDRILGEVFGCRRGRLEVLAALHRTFGPKLVPHVCAGLFRGRIVNEARAIEELSGMGIGRLVMLVFRPTPGTAYARFDPPRPARLGELFHLARQAMETKVLKLGCMRPGGKYRAHIDLLALECGFDGIVNPAPEALKEAVRCGAKVVEKRACCAL